MGYLFYLKNIFPPSGKPIYVNILVHVLIRHYILFEKEHISIHKRFMKPKDQRRI